MSERQFEFTSFKRVRVAMGTWNVNGGKQFRSNILGTSELTDWLLDSPKLSGVSEFQGKASESENAFDVAIGIVFLGSASQNTSFDQQFLSESRHHPEGHFLETQRMYSDQYSSVQPILHHIFSFVPQFPHSSFFILGGSFMLRCPWNVPLFFILPFLRSIENSCVSGLLKLTTEFHMNKVSYCTVFPDFIKKNEK